MFDPRGDDLSKLKEDDLVERVSQLHSRMKFFMSIGNTQAILQLNVMLAEANEEQSRRWNRQTQLQAEKQEAKDKQNILDK
jgi:hypothetical protein|tara:strand:+ start:116 stop:358 length:243 start_codon:yes stop_codon:yes gene_type:complete